MDTSSKNMTYKQKYTFDERLERSRVMKQKYPNKLPIVLVPDKGINLKSTQFLINNDLTFAQFISIVRKTYAIELKSNEAIFCIVNKILPPSAALLSSIYNEHCEPDGILYVHIQKESTFG